MSRASSGGSVGSGSNPTWGSAGSVAAPAASGAALDGAPGAGGETLGPPGFEVGGLLGRGGMGEVRLARDRRLGRDVALKAPHPGDRAAAARLAREAALTAGLEHPNIVPVYAAGADAAGRPWYAMRLLSGRSLADLLPSLPAGPPRLRALRHVLDAAEGLAYAHARGVLHRDVKPANLMIGARGETVLADWGLAVGPTEQRFCTPAGTPGYMAPEQERAGPLDARADVYGLGATLHEVLAGPLPPGRRPEAVRVRAPWVPAPLASLVDAALDPDPAGRPSDAGAFAADLRAFMDGQRVRVHRYTWTEEAERALARFRVPLAVGALGLAALSAALTWGAQEAHAERVRAEAAARAADEARRSTARALAAALAAQAAIAAQADRAMDAELLAAHALLHDESPTARGILARFGHRPRFAAAGPAAPLPDCLRRAASRDGRLLLCIDADGVSLLSPFSPDTPPARAPGAWLRGGFDGADAAALLDTTGQAWRWDPPNAPVQITSGPRLPGYFGRSAVPGQLAVFGAGAELVLDRAGGGFSTGNHCGPDQKGLVASVLADQTLVIGCQDHRVLAVAPGGAVAEIGRVPASGGPPTVLATGPDGALWVGTLGGQVGRVDGAAPTFAQPGFVVGAIAIGERLGAAMADTGEIVVWELATQAVRARLQSRPGHIAWAEPDRVLRVLSDRAELRRVPAERPSVWGPLSEGVGALAVAPSGAVAAAGLGDGTVVEVDLHTASAPRALAVGDAVVKDLAYALDGSGLAVASAGAALQPVFDAARALAGGLPGERNRRVSARADGRWWVSSYRPMVLVARPGEAGDRVLDTSLIDLERRTDGAAAVGVDAEGRIWLLPLSGPPRAIAQARGARAVALGATAVLAATDDTLLRWDLDGNPTGTWSFPTPAHDLDLSADGRWAATAHQDGELRVWDLSRGALQAVLVGHAGRVGRLRFLPDGLGLVSGGWDRTLRLWDLRPLAADPVALVAEREAAWGRSLADLLPYNAQSEKVPSANQ